MIGKTFTKLALLGVGFFYSVAAKPGMYLRAYLLAAANMA